VLKFVLVVLLFAAAVYALMWALEQRRFGRNGGTPPARPPVTRPWPGRAARPQGRRLAPDDDEDFLRSLDRKRKRDGTE
jgi:hypothetical protein